MICLILLFVVYAPLPVAIPGAHSWAPAATPRISLKQYAFHCTMNMGLVRLWLLEKWLITTLQLLQNTQIIYKCSYAGHVVIAIINFKTKETCLSMLQHMITTTLDSPFSLITALIILLLCIQHHQQTFISILI